LKRQTGTEIAEATGMTAEMCRVFNLRREDEGKGGGGGGGGGAKEEGKK
jgi:hypothetical protein